MSEEVNYKKDFCLKYFGKSGWQLGDVQQRHQLEGGKSLHAHARRHRPHFRPRER